MKTMQEEVKAALTQKDKEKKTEGKTLRKPAAAKAKKKPI